jgi:hypothetical protein
VRMLWILFASTLILCGMSGQFPKAQLAENSRSFLVVFGKML